MLAGGVAGKSGAARTSASPASVKAEPMKADPPVTNKRMRESSGCLSQARCRTSERGMRTPERRDDDELVASPLGGLAELDAERFPGRGDYRAIGQGHLTRESPGGVGDHGDPVAAPELGRVRVAVHVHVGKDAQELPHRGGVRFASVDGLCKPR